MARRRALPKVTHALKVVPAVDATPDQMWEQSGWKLPEFDHEVARDDRPERQRTHREPCLCQCMCGGSKDSSQPLCWLCNQGIHHKCTNACAEWPQVPLGSIRELEARLLRQRGEDEQVQDTRRDHKFSGVTAYVPPRAACNGGRDAGIDPKANRAAGFYRPD